MNAPAIKGVDRYGAIFADEMPFEEPLIGEPPAAIIEPHLQSRRCWSHWNLAFPFGYDGASLLQVDFGLLAVALHHVEQVGSIHQS